MGYLVGLVLVLALSVLGCSEAEGTGGSGGDGGVGGDGGSAGRGGEGGTSGSGGVAGVGGASLCCDARKNDRPDSVIAFWCMLTDLPTYEHRG